MEEAKRTPRVLRPPRLESAETFSSFSLSSNPVSARAAKATAARFLDSVAKLTDFSDRRMYLRDFAKLFDIPFVDTDHKAMADKIVKVLEGNTNTD